MLWLISSEPREDFLSDNLFALDRASGTVERFYRHELLDKYSFFNYHTYFFLSGTCSFLSGTLVARYVYKDALFMRLGTQEIRLRENVAVNVEGPDNCRVLTVKEDGSILAQIQYTLPPDRPKKPEDFPAYMDEEDFDYGLFLKNLSLNLERDGSWRTREEDEKKRKASGFYNVERKLLEARGWKCDSATGDYYPPV